MHDYHEMSMKIPECIQVIDAHENDFIYSDDTVKASNNFARRFMIIIVVGSGLNSIFIALIKCVP